MNVHRYTAWRDLRFKFFNQAHGEGEEGITDTPYPRLVDSINDDSFYEEVPVWNNETMANQNSVHGGTHGAAALEVLVVRDPSTI